MELSEEYKRIKRKINKLASEDELFYIKHTKTELEKLLNLKKGSADRVFLKIGINLRKKRDAEFINYFYDTDFKDKIIKEVAEELKIKTTSLNNKLKFFFGVRFDELKKDMYN